MADQVWTLWYLSEEVLPVDAVFSDNGDVTNIEADLAAT